MNEIVIEINVSTSTVVCLLFIRRFPQINIYKMILVILLVLAFITLFRVVATKFMCLNAGRVLHNRYSIRISG